MIPLSNHPNKDRVAKAQEALAKLESIEDEIKSAMRSKKTLTMYFEDPILKASIKDFFRKNDLAILEANTLEDLSEIEKTGSIVLDFEGFKSSIHLLNGTSRICVIVPKAFASTKNITSLKRNNVFYFCAPIDPRAVTAFIKCVL